MESQVKFCRSQVGCMCYQPRMYIHAVQLDKLEPDWP